MKVSKTRYERFSTVSSSVIRENPVRFLFEVPELVLSLAFTERACPASEAYLEKNTG